MFFFKQKTAYESYYGRVGSEMCIRDRDKMYQRSKIQDESLYYESRKHDGSLPLIGVNTFCLLYTSDAADERSSVDLGGRRIIKKKKAS